MNPPPDFRAIAFLREHIAHTMAFYAPNEVDPSGGFFHYYRDDGSIYDHAHRHLVSSTRFVYNHATAAIEFADPAQLPLVRHGLAYMRNTHRDPTTGGYAWTVHNGVPEDRTNHCYGLAFVLLAYSVALRAGATEARPWIDETRALVDAKFWDAAHGLYADEASADWSVLGSYRGQNANMHLCEALIAAYEATKDASHLDRALALAERMTQVQARLAGGLVWEHYGADWRIDWNYNRDDPRHLFRPWGFQPGHQTEWAKLLLQLDVHTHGANPWLVATARHLFDRAWDLAWDPDHGGLFYGVAPDNSVCDSDKYFWVQAESIAAAARLAVRTGEAMYWTRYDELWHYAWNHFVDHDHGAWYRILRADNTKYSDEKSPAGKTDYHTMGACHDVLSVLRAGDAGQRVDSAAASAR